MNMDDLFLTDDQLARLTGYRQRAKQVEQLRAQRIPFTLDRAGRPRVASTRLEEIAERQARQKRIVELSEKWRSERKEEQVAARAKRAEEKAKISERMRKTARPVAVKPIRLPPKSLSSATRRARLRQRTPSWSDRREIRSIYEQARRLTQETGEVHHVDHYYPLAGEFVSGLHVPANLKCLPAAANKQKHNKMPEDHQ
jgi:hypothetical protein